jgi:hypothetical protein
MNAKPQSSAMLPTLTSTSGEQYPTMEEKMYVIANISCLSNVADIPTINQDLQETEESHGNTDSIDGTASTVCPTMLNNFYRELTTTRHQNLMELDGRRCTSDSH